MIPKKDSDGTYSVVDVHGCVWATHLTLQQARRFIADEAETSVERGEDVHDWANKVGAGK